MIQAIFNTTATIKRRKSYLIASRDVFNNPIYGAPTATWDTIYTDMPARFAFHASPLQFAPIAERVTPAGVVYIPPEYIVYHEDRVLVDGVEYVVVSVNTGYINNTVIDHYELEVELP